VDQRVSHLLCITLEHYQLQDQIVFYHILIQLFLKKSHIVLYLLLNYKLLHNIAQCLLFGNRILKKDFSPCFEDIAVSILLG